MRYFLGFLIIIGLIVLVFVLVLKAFSGGGSKGGPAPKPLINYANTATTMQLTIDGPENANQTHEAIQINVGETQAQLNVLQGYEGNVTNTQSFPNNQSAYAVFLRALDMAGYTKGNSNASSDYRGYCPFGQRYIYKIIDATGKTTQQYWSTSCGGQGTFKGSVGTVNKLFKLQIPTYGTLTQKVNF